MGNFSRYELLERVGVGGMAEVFRARAYGNATPGSHDSPESQPIVCIKRILPHLSDDPEYKWMFTDEAKIASSLDHPNIVKLLDLGSVDGQLFLALEYVDGADISRLLTQSRDRGIRFPMACATYVLVEVLKGLEYAHRRIGTDGRPMGIVHRDVGPANVLVSRGGSVKLTDFGVAKATVRSGQTVAGVIKGNTRYMAPEQISGGPVDPRTDLYAAGILLHTLLCGRNPFEDDPLPRVLDRTLKGDIPHPSAVDPLIPDEMDEIVDRALRYSPEERFVSALEFRGALESFVGAEKLLQGKHGLSALTVTLLSTPNVGATGPRESSPPQKSKSIVARLDRMIAEEVEPSKPGVSIATMSTALGPPPARSVSDVTSMTPMIASADLILLNVDEDGEPLVEDELSLGIEGTPEKDGGVVPESTPASATTIRRPLRTPALRAGEGRLTGHREAVTSVAISPDGSTMVSASHDQTLKVWDLAERKEMRTLKGHRAAVTSLALSADGSLAISGARDRTVRVWEVSSGIEIDSLEGHRDWVFSVALSPDGRQALSGSFDRTVRLWNLETGNTMRVLDGHRDSVASVNFLPPAVPAPGAAWEGLRALSAGYDRTIRIWSLADARSLKIIRGEMDSVRAVAVSADGQRAISAGADCLLRYWDLASGNEIRKFGGHLEPVVTTCFSPTGNLAASGSYDGTIRLWSLDGGNEVKVFQAHQEPVLSIAFGPDGSFMVSGSADKTLAIWDLVGFR